MQYRIRVKPGSRKGPLIVTDAEAEMTVYVTERAIDGAANAGVVRALANHFAVAPSRVRVLHGHNSRVKWVEVDE